MALIELSRGKYAIVDDDLQEVLLQGPKWSCDTYGYAVRHVYNADGKRVMQKMHQLVIGERFVDHKNHDTLDNRRHNLRKANHRLNGANRVKQRRPSKSKFKGVWYDKRRRKWRATVKVGGKLLFIGRFCTEAEAALAYDKKSLEIWGDFAKPNFLSAEQIR